MTAELRELLPKTVDAAWAVDRLRARAIRALIIGLVAALVLAVVGALGTQDAPFGRRLVYWLCVVMPGSLLGLMFSYAVQSWGGLQRWRWLEILLVSVLVALPHTFVVVVASAMMFGLSAITPDVVLWFGVVVLFVSLVLTTINFATAPVAVVVRTVVEPASTPVLAEAGAKAGDEPPGESAAIAAADPAPPSQTLAGPPLMPPALAERLPLRLQSGRLLALQAEDHYLRIHTDLGSDLVLMRMTDAAALLADVPGARVHRSWWVARGAVASISSDGARTALRLAGGPEVPVSRTARRELAAAGWL
ncbi:LytTR family DNA-binding domain-containing protein [Sandarakinorhabdus sp.]|uniref:LytTR family DNA-binding domain-containing protein n=1 Tax=Sandarakinorhabdus sp. TaxID=1916663 RepID=UPI00334019DD